MPTKRRGFGHTRKLPSGKWQASYADPDGKRRNAPTTFPTKREAAGWLAARQAELAGGRWRNPDTGAVTFATYAERWLVGRTLRPTTRAQYRRILDRHLLPAFGARRVDQITPADVREWHTTLLPDAPAMRAYSYALLRSVLSTAVADEIIPVNPCRVTGAGTAKRSSTTRVATLDELRTITENMPERLRAMVTLAAWCGLRHGELLELRRADVDVAAATIRVRRACVWVDGRPVVGPPKSQAGSRDVAIPPHVLPQIAEHLLSHTAPGAGSLLFPGRDGKSHLRSARDEWQHARAAAGRDDLRFHDLRHTSAVLAAMSGATLRELMSRLGHTTPAVALRYQSIAEGRDRVLADNMSRLAVGQVVDLDAHRRATTGPAS